MISLRRLKLARVVAAPDDPGVPTIQSLNFHDRRARALGALKPSMIRLSRAMDLDVRKNKTKKAVQAGLDIAVEHLADNLTKGHTRKDLKSHVKAALKAGLAFLENQVQGNQIDEETHEQVLQSFNVGPVLDLETIRATEALMSPRRKVITWSEQ